MWMSDLVTETGEALRQLRHWVALDEWLPNLDWMTGEAPLDPVSEPATLPSRFVSIGGVGLRYIERGRRLAPPVVYIHGAGAMAEELFCGPLGEALARRYRVIAFDRPGYGLSGRGPGLAGPRAQALLIRAAMARLDLVRPVLIGHSWGGALALAFGVGYGKELAGLVHLSGWAFPASHAAIALSTLPFGPVGSALRAAVPSGVTRSMTERLIERIFSPDPVPASYAGFPLGLALRQSQLQANNEDLLAINGDVERMQRHYPAIEAPLEVVIAEHDRIVDPERHGVRLAQLVPGARLTRIERHGHMAHQFAPDAVVDAVGRLLG